MTLSRSGGNAKLPATAGISTLLRAGSRSNVYRSTRSVEVFPYLRKDWPDAKLRSTLGSEDHTVDSS